MVESLREHINRHVDEMKPGQNLMIGARQFTEAFPPSLYTGGNSVDRFLGQRIGSAYGNVRVRVDPCTGHHTISKHEDLERSDGGRYFVDADRRHLFNEKNGLFYHKNLSRDGLQD